MAECFYCEKDNEKRKALMLDVCELPYSIVYLFRDQKNKGRCVVAFKGHKTEYFQLTPEENAGYFADVAKVAKVLDELYHPDKINYATYGDGMRRYRHSKSFTVQLPPPVYGCFRTLRYLQLCCRRYRIYPQGHADFCRYSSVQIPQIPGFGLLHYP